MSQHILAFHCSAQHKGFYTVDESKVQDQCQGTRLPYNKVQDESAYKFRINAVGHEKLYNVVQDESAEFWFGLGHAVL